MTKQQMSVCYILGYYDPDYVRTRSLVSALDSLDGVELTEIRNSRADWRLYVETLVALLRWRRENHADVYILGFRGHEIYWPARLITRGRPLILDAFLSPSEVLLNEGKHGRVARRAGRMIGFVERQILQNASHLLTDTDSHATFFSERFGVPAKDITAIPVGTSPVPKPSVQARNDGGPLRLLYYGSMLPLHGLESLLAALKQTDGVMLSLRLIGGTTEDVAQIVGAARLGPEVALEHSEWVSFADIVANEIPHADLCLGGPFGATPQAMRVITGKTYQFLASSRATLVGRNADHEAAGFADRRNCLMATQGDPTSISEAIRWAADNRDRLPELGLAGRALFDHAFSTPRIAEKLDDVLRKLTAE